MEISGKVCYDKDMAVGMWETNSSRRDVKRKDGQHGNDL